MAIYHCSMKAISRGAGQSIVASAAYRHACKLKDLRSGIVHDYSRKRGVESSRIFLPSGVKLDWALDRAQLWNAAENSEKRKDARIGRELVLALPAELSSSQREDLAGEMACHLANRYHLAVDVAIHQPNRQGDERNFHAHILISSRRITQDGFGEKARELDDRERGPAEVEHIRATWAQFANIALERCGQERIDHRSLQAQGITRFAPVHLGPSACAMERRGLRTRLGDRNRSAGLMDRQIRQLQESLTEAAKALTTHSREFLLRTLGRIHEAKAVSVQRETACNSLLRTLTKIREAKETKAKLVLEEATVENVVGLDVLRQAREDQERAQEARKAAERRVSEQRTMSEQERVHEAQEARRATERQEAEQKARSEQERDWEAIEEALLLPLKQARENAKAVFDNAWDSYHNGNYCEASLEIWEQIPLHERDNLNKGASLFSIGQKTIQNCKDFVEKAQAIFDNSDSLYRESLHAALKVKKYITPENRHRELAKAISDLKIKYGIEKENHNPQEQNIQEKLANEQRLEKEHQHRKDRRPSRGPGMGM